MGGGGDDALGPFLGAYLAHKTGLIDLNDKNQQKSLSQNGVMKTIFNNQMNTPQNSGVPYQPPQGGFGSNADYSMQPVAPKLQNWADEPSQITGAAAPDQAMNLAEAEPDFLSGIGSFASMFV